MSTDLSAPELSSQLSSYIISKLGYSSTLYPLFISKATSIFLGICYGNNHCQVLKSVFPIASVANYHRLGDLIVIQAC